MQLDQLQDPIRQRSIPYAFYPSVLQDPLGQVLFSVGFGGQREGYGFLARHWSELGYDVFVCQHVGSDLARLNALKNEPPRPRNQLEWAERVGREVLTSPDLVARPQDIAYLAEHARQRRADLALFLAGHSFGALTMLGLLGGTLVAHSASGSFSRVRLRLKLQPQKVILLSLQPEQSAQRPSLWDGSGLDGWNYPTLIMTGTLDSGMPAGTLYQQRVVGAQRFPSPSRTIGLIRGADHMDFAGVGLNRQGLWQEIAHLTGQFLLYGPKVTECKGHALWDEKALEYATNDSA